MERDAIWQAFADTGDPLYYLLYKQSANRRPAEIKKKKSDNRSGEMPRPED